MAINLKKSIGDPIARDIGNQAVQGRIESKTIQMSYFTTNENAAWASRQQLQKESYPFAVISFPVNRNHFRLEVGDAFKLNFAKYGISGMVCRVLLIEEENLESEKIKIHCMEDIFSVAKAITEYSDPVDSSVQPPSYTVTAFTDEAVFEAPYLMTENIRIVPLAKRESDIDLGMQVHMSIDSGSSYFLVTSVNNIVPYGTLQADYNSGTYSIDRTTQLQVDFPTSDIDNVESITFAETLAGNSNMMLIGNELFTFQNITPVSGTVYQLDTIIRGRFGTVQEDHSSGADVWLVNKSLGLVSHNEILKGAARKFKLPPFNSKNVGAIADSTAIDHTVTGKAKTPYIPVNFNCNGVSFASRYTTDCVLTWNGRKRGDGAGLGIPGTVLASGDLEGYFDVEVYVSSIKVRTQADLTVETWTYTEAMNLSDNGSLATEIEFKLTNHRTEGSTKYTTASVSVITKLAF